MDRNMTIGQLARHAAVPVQTIRFYERRGLLPPAGRRLSGYRVYDSESLKRLRFVRRAQRLGFTLKEIQELLDLRIRSAEGCNRVRAKAARKLVDIQARIAQLRKLERILRALIADCDHRVVSERCPIIERMEV